MPKDIEKQLKKSGKKKGLKKDSLNDYIYGTLRKKFGWKPRGNK